ncbi:Asp-tRNA(Asn)/Glu-tRNA(Gln) amidotransferase subunit GatC [Patescibacteria group bacterium]|nr:Asp-tRNA(Asn)/Glu-tRNA(Gln) amidotransferase subunit GatC [Patescibacteria group bacterium]
MNAEDIRALAELSRLELNDEDIESYRKDFDGILRYISTINSVSVDSYDETVRSDTTNMMRDDNISYTPGDYTEVLLEAAPKRAGEYVQVDKVL